jgi:two-component system NtrC family response regulator
VVERDLFGEAGDAAAPRGGLFGRARGGTLYVREIGALDMRVQGMLLRALEHGGDGDEGRTSAGGDSVRVIASSLDDLARRVGAGVFRAELFRRVSAVRITLPPLRERRVDVRLLAEHFLRMPAGRRSLVLSDDAVEALENYRWPGNVRELRSVVQRAALLASDGIVRAAHLRLEQVGGLAAWAPGDGLISLDEMERRHIQLVLEHVAWHQGRAAGILGISPKTLYRKMRGYGLRRPVRPGRRTEREHMA